LHPEHIDIDISELMLHQGVRVRDLPQDGKWKAVSDPDTMIVHVVPVKVEEAPVVEAAAAIPGAVAAEPEVIKKGKKDEDDEKPEKKDKK
jgi:large subunit ribosomal protein L25